MNNDEIFIICKLTKMLDATMEKNQKLEETISRLESEIRHTQKTMQYKDQKIEQLEKDLKNGNKK